MILGYTLSTADKGAIGCRRSATTRRASLSRRPAGPDSRGRSPRACEGPGESQHRSPFASAMRLRLRAKASLGRTALRRRDRVSRLDQDGCFARLVQGPPRGQAARRSRARGNPATRSPGEQPFDPAATSPAAVSRRPAHPSRADPVGGPGHHQAGPRRLLRRHRRMGLPHLSAAAQPGALPDGVSKPCFYPSMWEGLSPTIHPWMSATPSR